MDNEELSTCTIYSCLLCQQTHENSRFFCSSCVNNGEFFLPQHRLCTIGRRDQLISSLNENDLNEFKEYMKNKKHCRTEFECLYALFILKKFRLEKQYLQNQFQLKWKPFFETNLMVQELIMRKKRMILAQQETSKLCEQIKKKKQTIKSTYDRNNLIRLRTRNMEQKVIKIKEMNKFLENRIAEKMKAFQNKERMVQAFRRKCFRELRTYIFPIEFISAIEGDLARRIKALSVIWDDDQADNQQNEDFVSIKLKKKKYRIVNCFLSIDNDTTIKNLVAIYNSAVLGEEPDEISMDSIVYIQNIDSPQLSSSAECFEILSALSHACQLINAIAHILDVSLPFRIHQIEFQKNHLTEEDLRANIAKLNANITSTCLAQGIQVENTEKCTLENLFNLLNLKSYSSRPFIHTASSEFHAALEKEIPNVSAALNNEYWFDHVGHEQNNTEEINSYSSNLQNSTITNFDQQQTSEINMSTSYMQ